MTTPRKPSRAAALRNPHREASRAFQRQFGKIEQVASRITYAHLWLAFHAGVQWQRNHGRHP